MTKRSWYWLGLLPVLVSFVARAEDGGAPLVANEIRVVAEGLKNSKGKMFCILFASTNAKDYPTKPERATMKTSSPIVDKAASCIFADVKPGSYAVAAFHDENDNGKLDTGFLGIPSEPTGASNDAHGSMGPPKFKDAQFPYAGGPLILKIKLE
jgi:uncharacterized protein (DUF2141 family)